MITLWIIVVLLDIQLHHIRYIKDPERPSSLEHLKVLTKDSVEVNDDKSYVRYVENEPLVILCMNIKNFQFVLRSAFSFLKGYIHSNYATLWLDSHNRSLCPRETYAKPS